MDRNTVFGLVLIAGIVATWMIFFRPGSDTDKQDAAKVETAQQDSLRPEQKRAQTHSFSGDSASLIPVGMSDSAYNALSDSAKQALLTSENTKKHGHFANLLKGEDRVVKVYTDKMTLDIHTRGAYVGGLYLNEYKTYDGDPLPIQRGGEADFLSLDFQQTGEVQFPEVKTKDLYFAPSDSVVKVTGDATQEVVLRATIDDRRYLEFVYTFKGNTYDYGLEIRQKGMDQVIVRNDVKAVWASFVPKTEATMQLMRDKTAIYYREAGSVEWVNPKSENGETVSPTGVDWVAFHSQFFTHTLLAEKGKSLEGLNMLQGDPLGPDPEDPLSGDKVKFMQVDFAMDIAKAPEGSQKFQFYAGPLDFPILKSYERDMARQIELGWGPLRWINRLIVIPVFNLLEDVIPNYGIIILILAILIKLALLPLTYRTQISTTKMRVVNNLPEMKALEEKYKDNPTKLQQEKMGVYRQMGVSLFGGCWPMLLSYPFLIAFFFFFPNAIELRQQEFLWANDLSTYDSILDLGFNIPFYGDHVSLFVLLMTASTYAFIFISQQNQSQMQTNPIMKWLPYIMPIFFLGFLNSYSAGLSWYYLLSNIISIVMTLVIKRFIDEDKLLVQLQTAAKEKKASGKGKSRMERWAEQQQQRQREMQRQRSETSRKGK